MVQVALEVAAQEAVLRLEVAVHDAAPRAVRERAREVSADVADDVDGEVAVVGAQRVVEVAAALELHLAIPPQNLLC